MRYHSVKILCNIKLRSLFSSFLFVPYSKDHFRFIKPFNMRFYQLLCGLAFFSFLSVSALQAQNSKSQQPSPLKTSTKALGDLNIKIEYSAPSVKGRAIWGGLVPYDKVWRTGANKATVFETNKDVTIGGQTLPAGKYGLFTIPGEKEWTIIFNKDAEQWGAYGYKKEKDVLRITAKPSNAEASVEQLDIQVGDAGEVTIAWEKVKVAFKVAAK
jgi:hypothetical protein